MGLGLTLEIEKTVENLINETNTSFNAHNITGLSVTDVINELNISPELNQKLRDEARRRIYSDSFTDVTESSRAPSNSAGSHSNPNELEYNNLVLYGSNDLAHSVNQPHLKGDVGDSRSSPTELRRRSRRSSTLSNVGSSRNKDSPIINTSDRLPPSNGNSSLKAIIKKKNHETLIGGARLNSHKTKKQKKYKRKTARILN